METELNVVQKNDISKKTDSELVKQLPQVSWELNTRCNFRCAYCFHPVESLSNVNDGSGKYSPEEIAAAFRATKKSWHIHLSGGEPFLYPDFIKLCRCLTEENYISINTNLSTSNVFDFASEIPPSKVLYINAAYHVEQREKLKAGKEKFVERFVALQDNGFTTYVEYVLYPPLFSRVKKDLDELWKQGVTTVECKPFRGVYKQRVYPAAYTDEQKIFIRDLTGDHEKKIVDSKIRFFGHPCNAGVNFFRMKIDGSLVRCAASKKAYGNLLDGTFNPDNKPRPCPFLTCVCSYEGLRNVQGKKIMKQELLVELLKEWPVYFFSKLKLITFRKHLRRWLK